MGRYRLAQEVNVNRIRRTGRSLARRASPLGPGELRVRQLAAGSVAADRNKPAPTTKTRRRTITTARLLPHTIQVCIHCRQNPAGFWVSPTSGQTVRRPWCLSCCQDLDPGRYLAKPFDS